VLSAAVLPSTAQLNTKNPMITEATGIIYWHAVSRHQSCCVTLWATNITGPCPPTPPGPNISSPSLAPRPPPPRVLTCIACHSRQPDPWCSSLSEVDHQVSSHGVTRVPPATAAAAAAAGQQQQQQQQQVNSSSTTCQRLESAGGPHPKPSTWP
jgi:hypothetical protein